jgi:hypothetical protein
VATGDVNGDGVFDIIAAQTGRIRVFDGKTGLPFTTSIGLFRPFGAYKGKLFLAAGDLNNDGVDDIVAGRASGPSRVRALNSLDRTDVLASFRAYEGRFRGGVRVAVGDLHPNPGMEIVTAPGVGRNADVRIFDTDANLLQQVQVYAAPYRRGVFLTIGDLNDDGAADLVVSPGGSKAKVPVRVLDGSDLSGAPLVEFFPFLDFSGPIQVGLTDADGDGFLDVAAARLGIGSEVKFINILGVELSNIQAYGGTFNKGLFLAASRRA